MLITQTQSLVSRKGNLYELFYKNLIIIKHYKETNTHIYLIMPADPFGLVLLATANLYDLEKFQDISKKPSD